VAFIYIYNKYIQWQAQENQSMTKRKVKYCNFEQIHVSCLPFVFCSLFKKTFNIVLDKLKSFLLEFTFVSESGRKVYKYAQQLSKLAHREQVSMTIDLDDLDSYDSELTAHVAGNSKRYLLFLHELV